MVSNDDKFGKVSSFPHYREQYHPYPVNHQGYAFIVSCVDLISSFSTFVAKILFQKVDPSQMDTSFDYINCLNTGR